MDGAELGTGGLDIDAGSEAAEELGHPMHASIDHRRVEVMRAGDDVGDDLGFRGIRDRRFQDADDRRRTIAEADSFADQSGIAAERCRPEAVGQHRYSGGVRPIVSRIDQPPAHRTETHHFEVRATDDAGLDDTGLAEPDHRERDGGEITERRQRLDASFEVAELWYREVRILDRFPARGLPDVDQPLLVTIRQRPQQDAANDAEDGGVGADSQCERDHHGDGQPLDAAQGPQSVAEVSKHVHGVSVNS